MSTRQCSILVNLNRTLIFALTLVDLLRWRDMNANDIPVEAGDRRLGLKPFQSSLDDDPVSINPKKRTQA